MAYTWGLDSLAAPTCALFIVFVCVVSSQSDKSPLVRMCKQDDHRRITQRWQRMGRLRRFEKAGTFRSGAEEMGHLWKADHLSPVTLSDRLQNRVIRTVEKGICCWWCWWCCENSRGEARMCNDLLVSMIETVGASLHDIHWLVSRLIRGCLGAGICVEVFLYQGVFSGSIYSSDKICYIFPSRNPFSQKQSK